jgi:hypothetical protein
MHRLLVQQDIRAFLAERRLSLFGQIPTFVETSESSPQSQNDLLISIDWRISLR